MAKMGAEPKRKLVIMNLDEGQEDEGVLNMCKVFGDVIHFNRPPLSKNFAFVTYAEIRCVRKQHSSIISTKNMCAFFCSCFLFLVSWKMILQFGSKRSDHIEKEKRKGKVRKRRIHVAQRIVTAFNRFKWKCRKKDGQHSKRVCI